MSRPIILCVNLPADKQQKLRLTCMRTAVLMQTVPPEDFTQPLGALCGLSPRAEVAPATEPFQGEMLILANLSTPQAKSFLAALRQSRVNIPLKAVVTPTNAAWDCIRLYQELSAEREAIASGQETPHTPE